MTCVAGTWPNFFHWILYPMPFFKHSPLMGVVNSNFPLGGWDDGEAPWQFWTGNLPLLATTFLSTVCTRTRYWPGVTCLEIRHEKRPLLGADLAITRFTPRRKRIRFIRLDITPDFCQKIRILPSIQCFSPCLGDVTRITAQLAMLNFALFPVTFLSIV